MSDLLEQAKLLLSINESGVIHDIARDYIEKCRQLEAMKSAFRRIMAQIEVDSSDRSTGYITPTEARIYEIAVQAYNGNGGVSHE